MLSYESWVRYQGTFGVPTAPQPPHQQHPLTMAAAPPAYVRIRCFLPDGSPADVPVALGDWIAALNGTGDGALDVQGE
jgi:hypothetical protein